MSIYIHGMDMSTKQVLAVINPDGLVEILNSDNILIEEFQATQVPPHGRLGDLDVLVEKAWDADTRCGYVQVVDVGDILDAPTIIEADKGVPIPPKSKEQQDLEDLVERLNREGIAP